MGFIVNKDFYSFMIEIKNKAVRDKIMYLNIFVDSDDEKLKELYVESAKKHNEKILNDPHFYDAGFDLFLPKNSDNKGTRFFSTDWEHMPVPPVNKVDFKVKCCAKIYSDSYSYFSPFYTYARSSISKTPLRLANNQGIIDAGYRGNLIGMFDCIYKSDSDDADFDWYMAEYSRILQICAPELVPIYINIVDKLDELGPSTSRGEGGFGSTGK